MKVDHGEVGHMFSTRHIYICMSTGPHVMDDGAEPEVRPISYLHTTCRVPVPLSRYTVTRYGDGTVNPFPPPVNRLCAP